MAPPVVRAGARRLTLALRHVRKATPVPDFRGLRSGRRRSPLLCRTRAPIRDSGDLGYESSGLGAPHASIAGERAPERGHLGRAGTPQRSAPLMDLSDSIVDHLRHVAALPDLSGTRYELEGEIGRGGIGVVYAALD